MFEQYIQEALLMVSAWEIPDDEFAQVVNDQAKLLAGIPPEDILEDHPETL
jgi:hypothetical protein